MKNNPILTSQSEQKRPATEYRQGKIHKNATTTWAIRRKIKNSKKSNVYLARKYGVTPLTIAKWKKRASVRDIKPNPSPRQKEEFLEPLEEALIFFLRRATGLSVDQMKALLAEYLMPTIKRYQIYNCLLKYRINKRQKDMGNPVFAQIMPILTKDRSVSFLMAFNKRTWKGFIHIAGRITQNLEDFKAKRPFDVLELNNPSVLNSYQKKNSLKAFESPLRLLHLESRLRKTMQYIETMSINDE